MEFDNVIVKENPGLCRCCLSEGCYKELGTEYPWMDETEVYADMLLECFDISISQHGEGPNGTNRLICEVCITRLRDACNFKKQVLDCEKKFVDMIGRGEFKQKEAPSLKCEINLEETNNDGTEMEYLDDGMDFDNDKDETNDITVETLPMKSKRGRPRKNAPKPEKKTKEDKPRSSKNKDEDAEATKEYSSERRRKNLQILFNNTTIIPFKWRGRFLCFYCAKDFTLYPEFRKHTKSHGLCSSQDYSLKTVKGSHMDIKLDISEITCEVCNEPFTKLDEIVDHLIVKHDMEYDKTIDTSFSEYRLVDSKCTFCDKDFTYFGYLMSHLNLAHPQNNFICDDCGATFSKKRDLVAHFREYHKLGGYPCEHCTEVFESHKKLQRHQNSYHFKKCFLCDFHFATHYLLRKHFRDDHADVKNNKCPHCSKQCNSSQGIKQHMKKCKIKVAVKTEAIPAMENFVQPKKKQNIVQIRNNILSVLNMSTAVPFKFFGKFSCFYCSIKFADFDDLKDHTALEHPHCDINSKCIKKCKGERTTVKVDISSLSCKLCSQPMEKLDSLIDHIISKHRASYDTSINNCFEPFRIVKDNIVCMSCPRVFRYFATLLRHTNSEHSNNSRICDFCGRSFKSATNLNVHISYAHTGACECEICGVKYKNQWCLSRHKAKCHNAKDFKCPNCPELFPSQYHRQKHLIKVHDIGHKCSYCGRMFTRNSFMKDHIRRTHLKEKNVECSICSEKFFDNYLLRLHMVKHEGVRKFSCDVCCKSFLRRSNLASHMGMHKKYGHVAAL